MLLHHYRFEPDTSLYDLDLFRTELAGSRSPIAPFKAALRDIQARLDEQFRAGADIRDLVRGRAWYLDQLLAIGTEQQKAIAGLLNERDLGLPECSQDIQKQLGIDLAERSSLAENPV